MFWKELLEEGNGVAYTLLVHDELEGESVEVPVFMSDLFVIWPWMG